MSDEDAKKKGNKSTIIVAVVVIAALVIGATYILTQQQQQGEYCTVTLDSNYDGAPLGDFIIVESGTEIDSPTAPSYQDHSFRGWYAEKECTNKITFPYKVTADVTFYARWSASAAAMYFNENFYTETEFGKQLLQAHKETTGFNEYMIEFGTAGVQAKSVGFDHVILNDMNNCKYDIFGIEGKKVLFSIPYDGCLSIKSIYLTQLPYELIQVEKKEGYYLYDLTGKSVGPSHAMPEFVLHSKVLFNDSVYGFDDKGALQFERYINPEHRPTAGDGVTYCELYGMSVDMSGYTHYEALNILDHQFDVLKTFKIPEKAVNCVCYYIADGKYLFQYSAPTESETYKYIDNEVKFNLVSMIVDAEKLSYTVVDVPYPAFAASDLATKWNFTAALSKDIRNVISFYKVDEDKVLQKDGKLLIVLNGDGTFYKSFSISESDYSFSFIFPLAEPGIYATYTMVDGKLVKSLVDASGSSFEPVLTDVKITTCVKYYITNEYTGKIYDANGNIVGTHDGLTLVGSTNNVLFFKNPAGMNYKFDNGTMTELMGFKSDIICKESFYGLKGINGLYTYFTENGTEMCNLASVECSEYTVKNGTHIAQIYLGKGEFAIFELTTE